MSDMQTPAGSVEPENKKPWVSPRVTKLDARSAEDAVGPNTDAVNPS